MQCLFHFLASFFFHFFSSVFYRSWIDVDPFSRDFFYLYLQWEIFTLHSIGTETHTKNRSHSYENNKNEMSVSFSLVTFMSNGSHFSTHLLSCIFNRNLLKAYHCLFHLNNRSGHCFGCLLFGWYLSAKLNNP